MFIKFFTFSRFTLIVALCISAIAAWYSVLGLTAIFAGAVIPIIIMGGILEIAKITTTVWLHKYWDRAGLAIKSYLTGAVIALAFLTSMGIFGFLSKSHLDHGVPTGDVAAELAIFDEKIKTERDNIQSFRDALRQMDDQVNQRLSRGTSEQGAERAVQIRRQQTQERGRLQKDIAQAQQRIAQLNEERAPVASKLRKVEAEVGPIKYFAALIYGDNPDANLLERAVRWVIIMIVFVFDPLAIVLILAANKSLGWERESRDNNPPVATYTPPRPSPIDVTHMTPWPFLEPNTADEPEKSTESLSEDVIPPEVAPSVTEEEAQESQKEEWAQNNWPTNYTLLEPKFNLEIPAIKEEISDTTESVEEEQASSEDPIQTEGVTVDVPLKTDGVYVMYEGKNTNLAALKHLHPDTFNSLIKNEILFGVEFPKAARIGDIYTRTDVLPHRTYKFNGQKWIMVNRNDNTSYLQNIAYLQLLIQRIASGEYDPELLTDSEQEEISNYLAKIK